MVAPVDLFLQPCKPHSTDVERLISCSVVLKSPGRSRMLLRQIQFIKNRHQQRKRRQHFIVIVRPNQVKYTCSKVKKFVSTWYEKINTILPLFVADICIPLVPIIYVRLFSTKRFPIFQLHKYFFRVAQIDLELHNLCRTAR